eukprot:scaffold2645_cov112-Isochrysis_galbana.AAC.13
MRSSAAGRVSACGGASALSRRASADPGALYGAEVRGRHAARELAPEEAQPAPTRPVDPSKANVTKGGSFRLAVARFLLCRLPSDVCRGPCPAWAYDRCNPSNIRPIDYGVVGGEVPRCAAAAALRGACRATTLLLCRDQGCALRAECSEPATV